MHDSSKLLPGDFFHYLIRVKSFFIKLIVGSALDLGFLRLPGLWFVYVVASFSCHFASHPAFPGHLVDSHIDSLANANIPFF